MLTSLAFYCVRSTLLFIWYTLRIITLGKRQKSVFQISKPGRAQTDEMACSQGHLVNGRIGKTPSSGLFEYTSEINRNDSGLRAENSVSKAQNCMWDIKASLFKRRGVSIGWARGCGAESSLVRFPSALTSSGPNPALILRSIALRSYRVEVLVFLAL